jgi:hypothetical protein
MKGDLMTVHFRVGSQMPEAGSWPPAPDPNAKRYVD